MSNWNNLSMQERAEIMKLAVSNGIYDLGTIRDAYNEYAKGGSLPPKEEWTMEDENGYQIWRSNLPDNLKYTDDSQYNMREAYKAGLQPILNKDGYYHLGSRNPKTGKILKSATHPTLPLALLNDAQQGYYPTVDSRGNIYTQTWKGNELKEGGSIHIKPSHRGRLTELKERTGKSEAELYNDGNPAHKKMVVFARNARKWKHGDGGQLILDAKENWFLTGGPKRGRMPAHPKDRKKDPEAYDSCQEWQAEMQERRQLREQQNREYVQQKAESNARAAEEFNRHKDTVMSALSNIADSVPFTGGEVARAAEAQRQEKLDKWHDIQKGMDATMTAAELAAAGYGVVRGLTHFNRMLARQATQSTGQAISREAMQNLLKWNNRVATVDRPQVMMNGIGGTADAYQWWTADNSFDAWENGLETGANAAGVVGGTNWFRNLPYLRRIGGNKIDAVLDGLGYGAAAWDVVKNLPPLSTSLKSARDAFGDSSEKHGLGGNLFDDGGDKDNIFKYTNSNGDVRYVYQNNPDSEEVPVRPLNTIFPDPAQWTFIDDAGKFYTPRRTTPTNTAELNPDNRTGFERALDNYIGEAFNTVPKGYHTLPAIGAAAFGLANPALGEAALTSGFGAHGLSKWVNGEVNGPLDAAMTALEVAPLGRVARPVYEGVVQPGMRLFNSPLTGNWTKIGNREYRLSPSSLGANGSSIESRAISPWIKELPIDETRYYRQVRPDALDSYKNNGVVSQFNKYGINPTRCEVPMFTKGKPSLYRVDSNNYGDVWVISKPGANLEWESIKGAAVSPRYKGEFNKAPISEFEFYQYDPAKGYVKLDEELNLPNGINFSKTPHIDYLRGLSEQQQIEYLTQNGLNDQWLWTLKNNPDHLESALSKAPIPNISTPQITAENAAQNGELVVSALPDYRGGAKIDFDLFKRFTDRNNLKEIMQNAETTSNNIDITSNILIDPDKRFMLFEPGRFINHDIGAMSVDEVVNTFGPEAAYYKNLYDVAKAHNFEGKYAKIGQDAEYNILNRFAINKADPDVAKGIAEARGIYDIPEYRARFNRWGTLGDTFVDDALARIDDVKLQGLSKEMHIKGQHGVHGGAYTSPDATTIGITNSDSSSWITDMIRHEANHVGHGLKRQPDWMRYHNEKIRPVVREGKTTNTPLDKYYDEMDEIVERSKTAIEYANKIRKEGETLDQALTRLADMADANIYNAEIPADIRQSIARYTKDSILNFWKNFVGGYAIPIGIGLGTLSTLYGASNKNIEH